MTLRENYQQCYNQAKMGEDIQLKRWDDDCFIIFTIVGCPTITILECIVCKNINKKMTGKQSHLSPQKKEWQRIQITSQSSIKTI